MIVLRTATGGFIHADALECTPEDARRLVAALTASSSTKPYGVVRLPAGCGLRQVALVADQAAEPQPKHAPIAGSLLGKPGDGDDR